MYERPSQTQKRKQRLHSQKGFCWILTSLPTSGKLFIVLGIIQMITVLVCAGCMLYYGSTKSNGDKDTCGGLLFIILSLTQEIFNLIGVFSENVMCIIAYFLGNAITLIFAIVRAAESGGVIPGYIFVLIGVTALELLLCFICGLLYIKRIGWRATVESKGKFGKSLHYLKQTFYATVSYFLVLIVMWIILLWFFLTNRSPEFWIILISFICYLIWGPLSSYFFFQSRHILLMLMALFIIPPVFYTVYSSIVLHTSVPPKFSGLPFVEAHLILSILLVYEFILAVVMVIGCVVIIKQKKAPVQPTEAYTSTQTGKYYSTGI